MPKCSFCGHDLDRGTGKLLIWNSGKQDFFCSNRCEKNLLKLKRTPLQTPWTKKYRAEHGKK